MNTRPSRSPRPRRPLALPVLLCLAPLSLADCGDLPKSLGDYTTDTGGDADATASSSGDASLGTTDASTTSAGLPQGDALDFEDVEIVYTSLDPRYPGEPPLVVTEELLGETISFDTILGLDGPWLSALEYDGFRVLEAVFLTEEQPLQSQGSIEFAAVEGTLTALGGPVDEIRGELEVTSHTLVDKQTVLDAALVACGWVVEHHDEWDLAPLKQSVAWPGLVDNHELDPDAELVAFEPLELGVALILYDISADVVMAQCGYRRMIEADGPLMTYSALFRLEGAVMERVLMDWEGVTP